MDPTVSIVMPAYNAALHIRSVIERFPPALWRRVKTVWIINDGSNDGTDTIIESLSRENDSIHPVHFPRNSGYGAAMRKGLTLCRESGCEFAACVHADGQYPPEAVLHFVETMAAQRVDLMQGSRISSGTALSGGMPLYKYIAGKLLTFLENRVFGLRMTDYHSGFLVYSRKCLETLSFDRLSSSFDWDLEMIASARARGLSISELPIPTRYADEKSHLNPAGYGLRVLGVLARYKSGYYHKPPARRIAPCRSD